MLSQSEIERLALTAPDEQFGASLEDRVSALERLVSDLRGWLEPDRQAYTPSDLVLAAYGGTAGVVSDSDG